MGEITITCADGKPIQELTRLLRERGQWLKETAEQSVTATMIDVIVSLRAITMMSKPKQTEVKLTMTALKPSYTGGRNNPQFCLRLGKARYIPNKMRIGKAGKFKSSDFKLLHVWRWDDFGERKWLIVARDAKQAQKWAYNKIKKRAKRFKGLAKLAMTKLLVKSGSKTSSASTGNSQAVGKSNELTRVTKNANETYFQLTAEDLLKYAKLALIGGEQAINNAIMKASNKIAAKINQKAKNLLDFNKLDTPFPEIVGRK